MLKRASNAPAAVQACQSAAACRCTAHATLTAIGSCSAHHRTLKERTHFKVASLFGGTRSPTVCRASSDVDQHTADSTQKLQSPTQQSTIISSSQPIGNHNITVYSHYSSSGRSHTPCSSSSSSRRELLLHSSLTPLLVQLLIGSDDATTIVNSVLSAYGLPTFKATAGFKLYDEFDDDFTFEYPKSWVSRPNTLRKGVYISDFQTADKVSVEELDLPADGDIATAAVAAAVYPGGNRLVEDATLTLPAKRLIKTSMQTVDGQEIMYLDFPSETITRSGYNIRRKNFAAAAVKRDKLYTIAASARSDQFNDDKKQLLQHIVQSFRLR